MSLTKRVLSLAVICLSPVVVYWITGWKGILYMIGLPLGVAGLIASVILAPKLLHFLGRKLGPWSKAHPGVFYPLGGLLSGFEITELDRVKRRIVCRWPLVGGWIRRRAARQLAWMKDASAAAHAVDVAIKNSDPKLRDLLFSILKERGDMQAREAACLGWIRTRHPVLNELLDETGWTSIGSDQAWILTALRKGTAGDVLAAQPHLMEALIDAIHDADSNLAARAESILRDLPTQEAKDWCCELVLRGPQRVAQDVAVASGYLPSQRDKRALFCFVTEQWSVLEREGLTEDFVAAYASCGAVLRQRISDIALRANHLGWAYAVVGGNRWNRLAAIEEGEWNQLIGFLHRNFHADWLWQLARRTTPARSIPLLRSMRGWAWNAPSSDQDRHWRALTEAAGNVRQETVQELSLRVPLNRSGDDNIRPESLASKSNPGAVAYSPGGQFLAAAGEHLPPTVWNLADGKPFAVANGLPHPVRALAFSPDGKRLAWSMHDNQIAIWDFAEATTWRLLAGHSAPVTAVAYHPSEPFLATSSADHTVRIWNLQTFETHWTIGQTESIWCLAFDPKGQMLALGGKDGKVRLCDWREQRIIHEWIAHTTGVARLAFAFDGNYLCTGCGLSVHLWRATDGRPVTAPPAWNDDSVSFAVTPDGETFAIGKLNGAVELWSLSGREPLARWQTSSSMVACIALSSDGRAMAAWGHDKILRMYQSAPAKVGQQLIASLTEAHLNELQVLAATPEISDDTRRAIRWIQALRQDSGDERPLETGIMIR